jgi:hypothetical protein
MGRKAHQWAACFTWSFTTFGIHSTQRAEAIHLVIHSFCSKHRSIVDLAHDLEQMAHHQQQKWETESLRIQLGQSLVQKLTPHAAEMIESQAAQIPLYNQSDDKNLSNEHKICLGFTLNEDIVCVTMNRSHGAKHNLDQSSTEFQQAMDFGLTDDFKTHHFASTRWCTCQFGKLSGLNCCRHMMFVRVLQNDQSEIVADKFWYRDEAIKATANPYSTNSSTGTFVSNGAARCQHKNVLETKEGHKQLLKSTMHIVSEAASESTTRTKSLISVLTEAARNPGMKEAHERLLSILDCQEPETTNSGSNSENQHDNSSASQIIANVPIALAANPPILGRFQNQRRKQPISCNPTLLSYKRKASEHLQDQTNNKKNNDSLPTRWGI